MMVSNVGSAAISAVSLVDAINILVIQALSALAGGATILCSQYIGSGNRNSSVSSTSSYKNREENIELVRIDTEVSECVDYIKYDVEGAEKEALSGSQSTISRCMPTLCVSLYHRSGDIFELPLMIKEKFPQYKLYMRRREYIPAWDTVLIAVKK